MAADPFRSEVLARRFVACFNAGDVEGAGRLLSEDAVWVLRGNLPPSGVWTGRNAILHQFLPIGGALFAPGSPQFTVTTATAQSDRCLLELHAQGQSAAGRAYENFYVLAFDTEKDQITVVREYLDSEAWRAALCT